jgi:hypothetical protein
MSASSLLASAYVESPKREIDQHQTSPAEVGWSFIDRRTAMNAILLTADHNTHIKIVAMGLSAAFMIALTALLAH